MQAETLETIEFLTDLFNQRGKPAAVSDSATIGIERRGGGLVEIYSYAPDATTHRGQYYYNSQLNMLYKKVVVQQQPRIAHWQPIGNR